MPKPKTLMIAGITLVVIAVILAFTLIPLLTKSPEEMEETEFSKGDEVWVYGIIADEKKPSGVEKDYIYTLEGSVWEFQAGEDLGDEGDRILVKVELVEAQGKGVWEAKSKINPIIDPIGYYTPTLIFGIIGIALIAVGGVRNRKIEEVFEECAEELFEEYEESEK